MESDRTMSRSFPRRSEETIMLCALLRVLSAHDRETFAHTARVARLAEATAYLLGQSAAEQQLIRLAALLHDIGKLDIPPALLHKREALTQDEWALMCRHPEIGQQLLAQVGGRFQLLAAIVVAHHERWDGQGYPAGLAGEEIPLAARILAVVDSYDAMISQRAYHHPCTLGQARAELQQCAGGRYDPCVVEAFLQVLDAQEYPSLCQI